MMDDAQKEYFRQKLQAWREELVKEAERTVDGMGQDRAQFADPNDRATLESDRNFLLRIRDRERKLIVKIDRALERIEAGIFGLCKDCGEEIEAKRLDARPVAELCVNCKQLREEEEKQRKS